MDPGTEPSRPPERARRRRRDRIPAVLCAFLFTLALLPSSPAAAAAAAGDVGYRSFSYGSTVSAPTGQKPQSKLWHNDGSWYGALWSTAGKAFRIYRLNWATQTWVDTGVKIDERRKAQPDVLWDGSHLWVASAVKEGSTGDLSARVLRYSYNSATTAYSLDAGYPITIANVATEAIVLDRDSTGRIWVTWTVPNGSGRQVMLTHSDPTATTFGAPFVLPTAGAANLDADDISTVVAYDGRIGVLWSNQRDDTVYFASHLDGSANGSWTLNPALSGPSYADDHMNIKAVHADPSGEIFAIVKTSLNDVLPSTSSEPLILLLTLKDNSWSRRTVWRVSDNVTRPLVLLDTQNRRVHAFAAGPCCSGGVVYYKSADLDNPSFATGLGAPFIKLASDATINNVTSTKQTVDSSTGLVVIAGDDHTRYYVHNAVTLGSGPPQDLTPPTVTQVAPADGATVAPNAVVTASFSEPMDPASITTASVVLRDTTAGTAASGSVAYDAPSRTATLTPTGGLLAGHGYQATVRGGAGGVRDVAGNALVSDRAWAFTVATSPPDGPPTVDLTSPLAGATVSGAVSLTAIAQDDNGVDRVEFRAGSTLIATDSSAPYGATWDSTSVANGAVTISATAFDGLGQQATDSAAVNVANGTGPPASFSDGFESGGFTAWSAHVTGGDGSATVQTAIVRSGTYAARLSETANTGSLAYARAVLAGDPAELSFAADVRVDGAGLSTQNVPLLRLFDPGTTRTLSFYRQGTSDGKLYVWDGVAHRATTGTLALGSWASIKVHVRSGSGNAVIEIWLNGSPIYQTASATFGTTRTVQIGNDTAKQPMILYVDNVLVTTP
jgi:hypothetical protein